MSDPLCDLFLLLDRNRNKVGSEVDSCRVATWIAGHNVQMIMRYVLVRVHAVVLKNIETRRTEPGNECATQELRFKDSCAENIAHYVHYGWEMLVWDNEERTSLVLSPIDDRGYQPTSSDEGAGAITCNVFAEAA